MRESGDYWVMEDSDNLPDGRSVVPRYFCRKCGVGIFGPYTWLHENWHLEMEVES